MVLGALVRRGSSATALGVGRDPSLLTTGTGQQIAALYDVKPLESVSRAQAVETSRRAGEMQAQLVVTRAQQRDEQAMLTAYNDYLGGNMDHAQFKMKMDAQLRRKQAQFGKAVARYQFDTERTQQNYDGYNSVLNASVATFSNM